MIARTWLLGLGLSLSVAAGAAMAQPSADRDMTTVCLDVTGKVVPAVCHDQIAGRLQSREDICLCGAAERVAIPVCPEGVAPPPESADVDKLRRDYVRGHHDLVGASWQGQPMCAAPRKATTP